ncbi:MAG: SDR family oxidoreductase [Nitrososphaeraceae archaeon]
MIKDKVVVITGASSGIGYTSALALSKAGAKIAAGSRRMDKLEKLENEISSNNGHIMIQKLDVTKKDECNSFVESTIKTFGKVDILINNAGLMPLSFIKNLKIDEWDKMIDVNVKGVLHCTAAVIPYMINQKGGHIINISSIAGRIVFPSGSVYCATKHAVTAFSEGLRQELSQRYNIRITCIEPGVVATELTNTITDEALSSFVEKSKQSESSLEAIDIANTILYALESPKHVNVNEIIIRPVSQEK